MWILGVRKLILATASVLVIGIGGTAMSHAADLGKAAPNPSWNTPASSEPSQHPQAAAALSKDDIREAQLELCDTRVFTTARSMRDLRPDG